MKPVCYVLWPLILVLLFSSPASAVSLDLQLSSTEYINGLVFYSDGSHNLNNATGSLSITNPSLNHTVSDINIDFSGSITPSTIHINNLGPNNNTVVLYQIDKTLVNIPVSVVETFSPDLLEPGVSQTVTFNVTITNSGSEKLTIIQFDKNFPPEFNFVNLIATSGTTSFADNTLNWSNISILPTSSESVQLIFTSIPTADISIQSSNLSFTAPTYTASTTLSLSAVTTTNFTVEKERLSQDQWQVGVRVWDESEFNYSLYKVEVYVSDTELNGSTLIKTYTPGVVLQPQSFWYDRFQHNYSGVPVFFARIYYSIPFTISGSSVPLTPVTSGGYILESMVAGTSANSGHEDKLRVRRGKNIIPDEDAGGAISGGTPLLPPPDESGTDIPDKPVDDPVKMVSLLTAISAAAILASGFIGVFSDLSRQRVVIGSTHFVQLADIIGYKTLFSTIDGVIMGEGESNKLLEGSMGQVISPLVQKGMIRSVEFDDELIGDLMRKYQIGNKDARALAVAFESGIKDVVVSPAGVAAAEMMGLHPLSGIDLINQAYVKDIISHDELEKMLRTLIYYD